MITSLPAAVFQEIKTFQFYLQQRVVRSDRLNPHAVVSVSRSLLLCSSCSAAAVSWSWQATAQRAAAAQRPDHKHNEHSGNKTHQLIETSIISTSADNDHILEPLTEIQQDWNLLLILLMIHFPPHLLSGLCDVFTRRDGHRRKNTKQLGWHGSVEFLQPGGVGPACTARCCCSGRGSFLCVTHQ